MNKKHEIFECQACGIIRTEENEHSICELNVLGTEHMYAVVPKVCEK